jgi:hypothetical protein
MKNLATLFLYLSCLIFIHCANEPGVTSNSTNDDININEQSDDDSSNDNNEDNDSDNDNDDSTDSNDDTIPTDSSDPTGTTDTPTNPNVVVAFIGDQGLGSNAEAVLELILAEGADMVLHQGDFDYIDDADAWDEQINSILGDDFPYFASIGNHDITAWTNYQTKLTERLERIEGASCEGDLGVNSACTYNDIFFILSGIGTSGSDHETYLEDELALTDATWRICSWHKNQELMQIGSKSDEVGWEAYEICREAGAIVATGHEHTYSRTHLMSDFENQIIESTDSTLIIEPGNSFVFVNGLGGKSIRDQDDTLAANPWWASVYSEEQGANYGALFCSFNHDDELAEAYCYFKDIDDAVIDEFYLTSLNN